MLFLQETHLALKDEVQWRDEFNAKVFLPHSTSNSCGVLIAFLGTNKVTVKKQIRDTKGIFLILEVEITDENL